MNHKYYPDGEILIADVLEGLKQLPDESVQTCITSPPYYGLRDYGTGTWIGGNADCQHLMPRNINRQAKGTKSASNVGSNPTTWDVCQRCGAKRQDRQIGLEQTPKLYVQKLTKVFREVRRILKRDGTLWLNIGDSRVGAKGQSGTSGAEIQELRFSKNESINRGYQTLGGKKETRPTDNAAAMRAAGLKRKDLIGIPWMVAFALRESGWYLRQDIIWSKPNPMVESVKDRCTTSHEYIFLFSKSEKYYYDYEAVREPATSFDNRTDLMYYGSERYAGALPNGEHSARKPHLRWKLNDDGEAFRNKRSVWHVPIEPYFDAHYATFPPSLIVPCILAGTRKEDVVLDPFAGSGTTLYVSRLHNRKFIGIDLNPKNLPLMNKRLREALRAEKPRRPLIVPDEVGTLPLSFD